MTCFKTCKTRITYELLMSVYLVPKKTIVNKVQMIASDVGANKRHNKYI